jgi:hypothetical protein
MIIGGIATGSKEQKRAEALNMSATARKTAASYENQTRMIIGGIATGSKEQKRAEALNMSDAAREKAASYEAVTRMIIGGIATGSKEQKRAEAMNMSDAERETAMRAVGQAVSNAKPGELSGRAAKRKKEAEMATLRTQFSQGAHAKTADGAVGVVVEDAPTKGRCAHKVVLRLVADGSHTDRLSLDALITLTEAECDECEAALEVERLAKRFKPTEEKAEKAKTKKTQG